MKFIVVEIKERDTFVLYDVVNKGVCCCSKYTLNQLVKDYKCEVVGFDVSSNKVVACGLDGTPRKTQPTSLCDDLTKRSAVTIAKGLPESKYPRNKTERAESLHKQCSGSYTLHTQSVTTDSGLVTLTEGDIKRFTLPSNESFVGLVVFEAEPVPVKSSLYYRSGSGLFLFVSGQIHGIQNTYKSITSCRIDANTRTYLQNVFEAYRQLAIFKNNILNLNKERDAELSHINAKYNEKIKDAKTLFEAKKFEILKLAISNFLTYPQMQSFLDKHLAGKLSYRLRPAFINELPVGYLNSASFGELEYTYCYDNNLKAWVLNLSTDFYVRAYPPEMSDSAYFYIECDGNASLGNKSLWDRLLANLCNAVDTSLGGENKCSVSLCDKGYIITYTKEFVFKSAFNVTEKDFYEFLHKIH